MNFRTICSPFSSCFSAISDCLAAGSQRGARQDGVHEMNPVLSPGSPARDNHPNRSVGKPPAPKTSMEVALRAHPNLQESSTSHPNPTRAVQQVAGIPQSRKRALPLPIDVDIASPLSYSAGGPSTNVIGQTSTPTSATITPGTARKLAFGSQATTPKQLDSRVTPLSISIPTTSQVRSIPEIRLEDTKGGVTSNLAPITDSGDTGHSASVPKAPTEEFGKQHFLWVVNRYFDLVQPLEPPVIPNLNPNADPYLATEQLRQASSSEEEDAGDKRIATWLNDISAKEALPTPSSQRSFAPVSPKAFSSRTPVSAASRHSATPGNASVPQSPNSGEPVSADAVSARNFPLPPSLSSPSEATPVSGQSAYGLDKAGQPHRSSAPRPDRLILPAAGTRGTKYSRSDRTSLRGASDIPGSPYYVLPPLSPKIDGPRIVLAGQRLAQQASGPLAGPSTNQGAPRASKNFVQGLPVVHLINTAGFGPQIGAGAFSTVHRTTVLINNVHTECAIKTFNPNYQYVGRAEAETQVDILNALDGYSDYIVKYYGHVSTAKANGELVPVSLEAEGSTISIAMELVNGPTVDNLEAGFSSLTTEERLMLSKKIVRDVLRGAAALSEKGFAHNDFKPNNLIWSEDENRVKLLDISNAGKFLDEKPMGHPFYTGPERIGRMPAEGLSTKAPAVAKTRLPEPFQRTAAESLQMFLDEFKEHYLPLHPTSDSYGIGQILHKLVQGTFFLPVDPKILQRHASDNFTDFKPLQLATIIGWAGKNKPAIVFDDRKKGEDPDYTLKDRHGFFDAVNNLMAVDYKARIRPEDALELPFFTENFPDEATCNALYKKCKNAAAILHEQNDRDALESRSASIYPPSQGPWAPPTREVLEQPAIGTATISTTDDSGKDSDLFQGRRTGYNNR